MRKTVCGGVTLLAAAALAAAWGLAPAGAQDGDCPGSGPHICVVASPHGIPGDGIEKVTFHIYNIPNYDWDLSANVNGVGKSFTVTGTTETNHGGGHVDLEVRCDISTWGLQSGDNVSWLGDIIDLDTFETYSDTDAYTIP
ncbi:MAG: hypothetical protein HY722_08315 [Planctomycetes bacterium]|nr:hypothetical protein [Planctomycetota bacterium]